MDLYWWGQDTDNLPQIVKVSVNGGSPTVVVKDGTDDINVLLRGGVGDDARRLGQRFPKGLGVRKLRFPDGCEFIFPGILVVVD
jgi:hypothetical protein